MDRTHPRLVSFIITDGKQLKSSLFFKVFLIQLSQLRLNPPRLGLKCGKRVERFSDFGKYKGNFRYHSTSLPAYRTLSQVQGGSTSADLAVITLDSSASNPSLFISKHKSISSLFYLNISIRTHSGFELF